MCLFYLNYFGNLGIKVILFQEIRAIIFFFFCFKTRPCLVKRLSNKPITATRKVLKTEIQLALYIRLFLGQLKGLVQSFPSNWAPDSTFGAHSCCQLSTPVGRWDLEWVKADAQALLFLLSPAYLPAMILALAMPPCQSIPMLTATMIDIFILGFVQNSGKCESCLSMMEEH